MQHFNTVIEDDEQLAAFLCSEQFQAAACTSTSILVQIYAGALANEDDRLDGMIRRVREELPHAVIVGATSAGEISQGRISENSVVLSVTHFRSSLLSAVRFHCAGQGEFGAGKSIAEVFQSIPDLRGILLLVPATRINCARLLEGIQCLMPEVPVFGGGAAEILPGGQAFVLHQLERYETDCVAVALSGAALHIETHVSFGWKAIGPRMRLTDADAFTVREIDGKPAIETYRKYLGVDANDDDIYLLEFPLLIERSGTQIARNPVAVDDRGGVSLVADVYGGETARLGYLDVDSVVANLDSARHSLAAFAPEAIFLYSCICRRFTLGEDIECETRPLQADAPVAGFFTSGEFCRIGGHLQLLNSSQVMVALREGDPAKGALHDDAPAAGKQDRYRFRHARITSRLFQFVTALTEEVEQANRRLHYQAEHDALTGALNRGALDRRLDAELSRSDRYNRALSLVMFDLDRFKRFNDEFGHAAGDHVLKSVVTTICNMTRGSDALYRYGGEEFVLLLPEASADGAMNVAEKARAAVEAMRLEYDGKPLPAITISLGVSSYPQHGTNGQSLLKAADEALYQSKIMGRNRVMLAG